MENCHVTGWGGSSAPAAEAVDLTAAGGLRNARACFSLLSDCDQLLQAPAILTSSPLQAAPLNCELE